MVAPRCRRRRPLVTLTLIGPVGNEGPSCPGPAVSVRRRRSSAPQWVNARSSTRARFRDLRVQRDGGGSPALAQNVEIYPGHEEGKCCPYAERRLLAEFLTARTLLT